MSKLKHSLAACAGLSLLIGLTALVTVVLQKIFWPQLVGAKEVV